MTRLVSQPRNDLVLWTRLAVLAAVGGATGALLVVGVPPVEAGITAVVGAVGGVWVGCQLTAPFVAPKIVLVVLVMVLLVIVSGVWLGYPVLQCLAVALTVAGGAVQVARRMAAAVLRPSPNTV